MSLPCPPRPGPLRSGPPPLPGRGARATARGLAAALVLAVLGTAAPAPADSIAPEVFETVLPLEETTVVRKTVTVEAGPPVRANVDVLFLSDTTGSMGSVIAQVQRNARRILQQVAAFGDARFGVAEYRDHTEGYAYRVNTPLTRDEAAVIRGLNQWRANGGGDTPEANLYGLSQPRPAWHGAPSR